MTDSRRADIFRAELMAFLADLDRRVMRQVALARCLGRLLSVDDSDELPSERTKRQNAEDLRAMFELGDGRNAASEVAERRFPGQPHMQEMHAQNLRRLRRVKKKRTVFV